MLLLIVYHCNTLFYCTDDDGTDVLCLIFYFDEGRAKLCNLVVLFINMASTESI